MLAMQVLTFRAMRASVKHMQASDNYTVYPSSLIGNAGTIVLECSTNSALSASPIVSLSFHGPVKSGYCVRL
jgi:hypothetical protein